MSGGRCDAPSVSTLVLWQGDYDERLYIPTKDGHAMREYLLRRLLLLIPTLLGVTFIVFLMMHFIPGDPVTNMMGETYSAEDAAKLRHELGLDQPMVVQYGKWLMLLLRGDWGRSILSNRPVLADILYRLPVSLELLVLSMLVSLLIAFPAGIIAAVWPNSWKDYSAMMVAMAGVSIPEFFLGVLLFLIFALTLRWFPVAGHINLLDNPAENLRHMLLPTIALGLPRAALLTRLIRASLLEVLRLEYVTTARAKGLSDWVVVLRHALKNAPHPHGDGDRLTGGIFNWGSDRGRDPVCHARHWVIWRGRHYQAGLSPGAGLCLGGGVSVCVSQSECGSAVFRDRSTHSVWQRGHITRRPERDCHGLAQRLWGQFMGRGSL